MADGCGDERNASAHKGSARRRGPAQAGLDADELLTLMHGSDPVKVELNRLENEVRDKDRELGEAQAEIKALRCRRGRGKRPSRRFESYVYDKDEDDLDASKVADFSLNPCSKLKKTSLKKTVKS